MNKNTKFLLGFIAGATAGVVAALLLAPTTGEENRKKISKTANKVKDDINSTIKDGLEKISKYTKGASEKVDENLS
jgi:gas vesicle protein